MSDVHIPSNLEPELRRCLEALDRGQTNITAYDVAYTTDPDVSVGAQLTTNIAAIAALAGGMQADQDYIITGLFQYNRGALAPFGVVSGAAYVPNLDSDKLDGYEGAELAALAEDETITGSWTFDAYTKFGTGTTTHALSASGDVLVSGKLEVDGAGYFDSTTSFFDQLNVDADIDFVNSTDQLKWTATKYITGTVGLELHDATLIQMYAPTSYFVGTAAAATLTVEFRRVSGATDSRLGVIGVADNFWTGTIAGDLVLQAIGATKTLWLLAGNNVFKLGPTGLTTGAGGAGVDYTYTIDGQTNDYVETWDEGNDVMYTSDAWLFGDAARIYFEASGTTKGTEYIASANDEHLDLYADTSVDCNAALDMSGNHITSCASLALAEQSPVPASAAANTLVAYAEAVKGFSFLSSLDDTGMRRKFQRDSVFVGKNTTGSSIPAFRAVYAIGSEDDVPLIAKARANNTATMPAIGVTLEAIAHDAYGRIMQIGLVENANTSAFAAGDILYVSSVTAGILVATAPLWPNIRQEIGTILAVDASVGSVQVVARSMFNEGILDHGGLLGLADNDHTQYLLLAGGTMTGPIDMGAQAITNGGAITGAAITGTSFVIGANTLDTNEWAYLDGQDQALKVADSPTFANVTVAGGGEVRFSDVGDSHYVGFEAPPLSATQIWVLPDADGAADEMLTTDGAGNLTWAAGGTGGLSITMNEDTWIGIGATSERIVFNGSEGTLEVRDAILECHDLLDMMGNPLINVSLLETAAIGPYNPANAIDVEASLEMAAGVDLDCYTNAAYFKPRRVSQSAIPTPEANELLVWRDSDDSKTYLVYNDVDEGVRSVEMT